MSLQKSASPIAALFSGLLFGLGLIVSGMVSPQKVQAFLDIFGAWDPSLALVMAGAIAVALPVFQWAKRYSDKVDIERRGIDRPLVVGSLLFGIGWGMSGYCPGPALVASSSGSWQALWYVIAMAVGVVLGKQFERIEDEPLPQFVEGEDIT